jgi:hypothetical protein
MLQYEGHSPIVSHQLKARSRKDWCASKMIATTNQMRARPKETRKVVKAGNLWTRIETTPGRFDDEIISTLIYAS